MKSISTLLEHKDSVTLLQDEIRRYIKAMNPKVPKRVQAVLYILDKYPALNSKEQILAVRDGKFNLVKHLDILPDDLKDLQSMLKKLGKDIMLLPQFLTLHQRQALEQGRLDVQDVTLDLDTDKGRDETAKKYSPLVLKIVNQYLNRCSLDKSELVSAGLMGLTHAMNTYKSPEEIAKAGGDSVLTFGQYAAWCIKNQILADINNYSSTVKQTQYMANKEGRAQVSSIDGVYGGGEDGDDVKIDRLLDLSTEPDYDLTSKEEATWTEVFKKIEKRFPARDCEVLYRVFGINGRKHEKAKDIAKELGVSAGRITQIIAKIIKYLKSEPDTLDVLRQMLTMYTESIMVNVYNQNRNMIVETFLKDDIYILLEEANQWTDAKTFQAAVEHATDDLAINDAKFIFDCLQKGFNYTDNHYRKMKNVIVKFLSSLYPTITFSKKSDVEILDNMAELCDVAATYKIKW